MTANMRSITYYAVPGIPLVAPGDNLAALISGALQKAGLVLENGDIVVLAQKIVSKSENRYVYLKDVIPSERAQALASEIGKDPRHIETVLSESAEVVRHRKNIMIVAHKLGYVMANAGIDESNIKHEAGNERVLLLPKDPDGSAAALREEFRRVSHVDVGVIINDSFGRAWRIGVVGVALGAAGVPSLQNMIGTPDLFGRAMKVTEIAIADELAAGASLVMGQGAEGYPVVVVRGFASQAPERPASALIRPREQDMFR